MTMYSSITKKPIGGNKNQELDLFKKRSNKVQIEYYIYKEENEDTVLTFNLSL